MSYWKTYCYVDGHFLLPSKTRRSWTRMRLEDLEEQILGPADRVNCFATIQRFRDAISIPEAEADRVEAERLEPESEGAIKPPRPDNQVHYHGLFFDFDAAATNEGEITDNELVTAQTDAGKLALWFKETFDEISECHIQSWFTGSKGFHVVIRPEPFDIRPHLYLTDIMKKVAAELAEELSLKSLDRSVYSRRRMWRIPNTFNPKGDRYKIELTLQELLQGNIGDILEKAKKPRTETEETHELAPSHLWPADEYRGISGSKAAGIWWRDQVEQWGAIRELEALRPRETIRLAREVGQDFPACIGDLFAHGPKPGGARRNRVLLPIAGFLKDSGVPKNEAHSMVESWTKRQFPTFAGERQRLVNGRSVVEQAYKGNLSFSCRYARGCSGPGEEGKVACVGESKCPWIKEPKDQMPKEMPFLRLADANNAMYAGTQIRSAVHVAAVATRGFSLPIRGKVTCTPDIEAAVCRNCPNNWAGGKGEMTWEFPPTSRDLLDMAGSNDKIKDQVVRRYCRIPVKCKKHSLVPTLERNLEELQIIPMVDYANAYTLSSSDSDDEDVVGAKANKHVVATAYYVGQDIKANGKYLVEMTMYAHPRDQRVCFLIDKAEAAQNDIDQFRMTPELKDKLRVFQPRKDQSVADKMDEIHRDLLINVHRISGRRDLGIALDLCYHAVIGFRINDIDIKKGWFELVVVGDSGTGKSVHHLSKVLTPTGWKQVGELKVGDEVIGRNGKPTKVLGVYPQGKLPTYEVTLQDGAKSVVSGDHLWSVGNNSWERHGHKWKVKTTEELLSSGIRYKSAAKKEGPNGRSKYWIPTVEPVEFAPQPKPPIDPWILGALIGDGTLGHGQVGFSNPEKDVVEKLQSRLPPGVKMTEVSQKDKKKCPQYSIVGDTDRKTNKRHKNVVTAAIREFGLDVGTLKKFIPRIYLWGSFEVRLEVLRGLCDTDGYVLQRKGNKGYGQSVQFSTSSPRLAEDFVFLVRSLGGLTRVSDKIPTYTYKGETRQGSRSYRIQLFFDNGICPVSSKKHLAVWNGKTDRRRLRRIESIEPTGKKEECICIKVDADDELYVIDDFVVTHNTTIVERMIEHYGLGELIAGEESRRTGLVYASIQIQGTWTLLWGKVPQNDRRLLVIDEFAGIPPEEVGKLTQLRSEGVARASGVNQHHTTWARTRLVLLTNPRSHSQSMRNFNYGVSAVAGLFPERQDLRRVDLALTANKADVPSNWVTKRWDKVSYPHTYTADLCRSLVLWAWSRDPQHVKWDTDAIEELYQQRERLGEIYDCDLTLAMREDLHLKLARMSTAVAARLFSTDEASRNVYVRKEHVEFVSELMDRSYRKRSMGYMQYASKWKRDNHFSKERQEKIKAHLRTYGPTNAQIIVSMLLDIDGYLNKGSLSDMLSLEVDDFKRLWRFLMTERLLVRKSKGFRKTDSFAELLRNLGVESTGYDSAQKEQEFLMGTEFDPKVEPVPEPFDYMVTRTNGSKPPHRVATHSGNEGHVVEFHDAAPGEDEDSPFDDEAEDIDNSPF